MQEKHIFEYAVIRIVPQVEREEFLNIGVVLYCPKQKFLEVLFELDEKRFGAFSAQVCLQELKAYVQAFESICKGEKEGGPIAILPIADRFRWLTAARSTVLQTSKIHPGFCVDAKETLTRLHRQMVL